MISFDQLRKALTRIDVQLNSRQINDLLADLLPNPQSGFSSGGTTVWGDSQSITNIQRWNHAHATIEQWRSQVDRHIRAEELGLRLLDFALRVSADNPASIGHVRDANELLDDLDIEPREGFYLDPDMALAEARTKFYEAVHRLQ